jgi:hypothetical protein
MIVSPGDVQKERAVVREVVSEWNSTNGAHRNVMLLAMGWETDVAPEMGDAPQSIIDKRILKDADLLVGMFWTRLGTEQAAEIVASSLAATRKEVACIARHASEVDHALPSAGRT